MTRLVLLWAGLAVLAAGGCFQGAFLSPSTSTARYRRVVDGPPNVVSSVLEEGFSGVGITVFSKRHGEEIRLAGQNKAGDVFCVYVRPDRASSATSTVAVKWDRQPDEQLWKSIEQWLAVCSSERHANN